MPLTPRIPDEFFDQINAQDGRWRWPHYRDALGLDPQSRRNPKTTSEAGSPRDDGFTAPGSGLPDLMPMLWSAAFIEWRYYAVLGESFHGIFGMALVNPGNHFRAIAESGLLVILAGRLGPDLDAACGVSPDPSRHFSWMHLFRTDDCRFDPDTDLAARTTSTSSHDLASAPLRLDAEDHRNSGAHRLRLRQSHAQALDLELETSVGIALQMTLEAVGAPLQPMRDARLGDLPGSHWQVNCPAPLAATSGSLRLNPIARTCLDRPDQGCRASPALLDALSQGSLEACWAGSSGYHEHSHGIRPLPLHGWDFLFAPDLQSGQTLVMQTYRGSKSLRYLDLRWRDAGGIVWHQHFAGRELQWQWLEPEDDSLLGVPRPGHRRILAQADGLRLEVDHRVELGLPLLRPGRLAVRHFYIHEELGHTQWVLKDSGGHILAQARSVRSGGETAGFRWRTPDLTP